MGRKKKRFIDKKNAVTFNLVHRSQNDPLLDELHHPQMVLASQEKSIPEDRTEEQQKYGIFYSDDYNYLQHLKEPSTVYPVKMEPATEKKNPLGLPSDLFGNEVDVKGLKRIVPVTGPQPDWDPEITEALDHMEGGNTSECSDELEDDFVLQANGGEPGVPVYCEEEEEEEEYKRLLEPWWLQKSGITTTEHVGDLPPITDDFDQSDFIVEELEGKSARFTEYSMSSSVLPRSEVLSNLDERFEEFMVEYDDDQIGPLEEEEEHELSADGREIQDTILNTAVEEFINKYENKTTSLNECQDRGSHRLVSMEGADGERNEQGSPSSSEEEEDEKQFVSIDSKPKWDCESILSTYSNLYNHPTLIKDPPHTRNKILLPRRVSTPMESSTTSDEHRPNITMKASTVRSRNETREEQRTRKQAIKQERRERRAAKKELKMVFKKEQLRQEQERITNPILKAIT